MDFPLQIGNLWQYSEVPGNYSDSRAIKDTLMANGLTYTQINGELFNGYFRKEESKVFLYNVSLNNGSLLYDFTLTTGDTVSIAINGVDTIVTTVFEEGTGEIFGLQRYYMAFITEHSTSTVYEIKYITDGIGFTAYNGEVLAYGLTGAIINGIQYGVINDVLNTEENIPNIYQLMQNYPNPFNPVTAVKYSVPRISKVSLIVYDVLGREIKTLVNGERGPGSYTVQFDGSGFSSGVYFYVMRADNPSTSPEQSFIDTKKLILLK
jgi:hypothetical protein